MSKLKDFIKEGRLNEGLNLIIKEIENHDEKEVAELKESFDLEMSYGLLEKELSPLQKEYKVYFEDTLKEFDTDSPAKLSAEKKIEFFNAIKSGWEVGKGKK